MLEEKRINTGVRLSKILHGHHKRGFTTKTYKTWGDMKSRCHNPKATGYAWYGGKGIKVCKKWEDFTGFLEDMGEKPEGLTLDRIDGSKDYSPENCRWATWSQQASNKKPSGISRYRGVYLKKYKNGSRWNAQIRINRKTIHIGNFTTEEEAATSYNNYAVKNNIERNLNIVCKEEKCLTTV